MIFYFSGTGNSKWVAEQIAKSTGDKAIDIAKRMKEHERIYKASHGESLGFVFPVYAWGPPDIVMQFAKGILTNSSNYVFAVCTCGSEAGDTIKLLSGIVNIDAGFSIAMPNNYVIGSKVDSQDTIKKKLSVAKNRLSIICEHIKAKEKIMDVARGKLAAVKSNIINKAFLSKGADTRKFNLDENCTSCEKCKEVCPIGSISFYTKSPSWGNECIMCMACINYCPTHAIHYGKSGQTGQYNFEKDCVPLL